MAKKFYLRCTPDGSGVGRGICQEEDWQTMIARDSAHGFFEINPDQYSQMGAVKPHLWYTDLQGIHQKTRVVVTVTKHAFRANGADSVTVTWDAPVPVKVWSGEQVEQTFNNQAVVKSSEPMQIDFCIADPHYYSDVVYLNAY